MKKVRILNLTTRLGLFILILGLGTIAALIVGETKGLALADLSGASVQVMASEGEVLYAGLSGGSQPTGIYRSNDRGRTWQVISSGPGMAINTLAVHPIYDAVLYAGTTAGPLGANNVWRSDDGGRTWHNFNLSLPASSDRTIPAVTAIVADSNQPEILYVGTDGHGVYRVIEGQLGFELIGGMPLSDSHIKQLEFGSNSRLNAVTNAGLFVTTDDTWQKIESLPEVVVSLTVVSNDLQTLYAGCPTSGVYRSMDVGQTWESINNGLELIPGVALRITALAVDEQDSQHVVAGTAYGIGSRLVSDGIYESRNGGRHWSKVCDADGLVMQLMVDQNGIFAATANGLVCPGQSPQSSPPILSADLGQLVHPTGSQVLILVLAVGLGVLVLLGRTEWLNWRNTGGEEWPTE
jgi:photosystem II stability/assembly factor-like uncharacterized protein